MMQYQIKQRIKKQSNRKKIETRVYPDEEQQLKLKLYNYDLNLDYTNVLASKDSK